MGSLCCKRSVARTSADVPGPTEKSVAVLATDNDSSMWLVKLSDFMMMPGGGQGFVSWGERVGWVKNGQNCVLCLFLG